jgi:hypothetical protein
MAQINVYLGEILNDKYVHALMKQVNIAYGNTGNKFWTNFFYCESHINDYPFLYFFTDHQLALLFKLLKRKEIMTGGANDLFWIDLHNRKNNYIQGSGRNIGITPFYCIRFTNKGNFELRPLLFNPNFDNSEHSYSETEDKNDNKHEINFFDGGFGKNKNTYKLPKIYIWTDFLSNIVGNLKNKLPKDMKFGRRNWLYYKGEIVANHGHRYAPTTVNYCSDHADCPFNKQFIYARVKDGTILNDRYEFDFNGTLDFSIKLIGRLIGVRRATFFWECIEQPEGAVKPMFDDSKKQKPIVSGFNTTGEYVFRLTAANAIGESKTTEVKVFLKA